MPPAKPPPTQAGLPMTVDPSTAIQTETARQQHDDRMRAADADRSIDVVLRAAAEVDSWPATTPAPTARPQLPPPPEQQPAAQRSTLPFYPTNTDEMWRYATMLARSKLLPKAFYPKGDWGKENCRVADVHVVLMKGHDLGLKPMQAIGNINVIDGKAEVGALLMVSLILKSGMCEGWRLMSSTTRSAVYRTKRRGDEPIEFEYTIEEAEQMGLVDRGKDEEARAKNQWRLQPRTMLRRRCQSHLAREVYPDIVMGLYDHDELSEMRERAELLGLRPEDLTGAIPVESAEPAARTAASLAEGSGPGPIDRLTSVDPLKERVLARRAAAEAVKAVNRVAIPRCSLCDSLLDPRDSDPCIACRPALAPDRA